MGLLVVPGRWCTRLPIFVVWANCNMRPSVVLIIVKDVLKIFIGLDEVGKSLLFSFISVVFIHL